jgi:hypothetical protein
MIDSDRFKLFHIHVLSLNRKKKIHQKNIWPTLCQLPCRNYTTGSLSRCESFVISIHCRKKFLELITTRIVNEFWY